MNQEIVYEEENYKILYSEALLMNGYNIYKKSHIENNKEIYERIHGINSKIENGKEFIDDLFFISLEEAKKYLNKYKEENK